MNKTIIVNLLVNKTKIYIARHGETEYNRLDIIQGSRDIELNEAGHLQAQTLATRFRNISIDAIYSSNLKRARQTAGYVAKQKKLEITTCDDLREMNFGDYEGLNYFDVKSDFEKLKVQWAKGLIEKSCKNGESPVQVFKRADSCCKKIFNENEGKSILMVLHGRLIRILFTEWFGWELNQMNQFSTPNVSFSLLEWENEMVKPVELNITDHLIDADAIY